MNHEDKFQTAKLQCAFHIHEASVQSSIKMGRQERKMAEPAGSAEILRLESVHRTSAVVAVAATQNQTREPTNEVAMAGEPCMMNRHKPKCQRSTRVYPRSPVR